jgi:uncharacterized membrane protein
MSVVHLVAALLALVTGTYILAAPKGTRQHRWVGRAYAGSMVVLLLTAFQIYFLFGHFGAGSRHWGSLVALSGSQLATVALPGYGCFGNGPIRGLHYRKHLPLLPVGLLLVAYVGASGRRLRYG